MRRKVLIITFSEKDLALTPKNIDRPLKEMKWTLKWSQFRRKDEEYSLTPGEVEIMVQHNVHI